MRSEHVSLVWPRARAANRYAPPRLARRGPRFAASNTYLGRLHRVQTGPDGCRTGRWGLWTRRTASLWRSARPRESAPRTRTAPRDGWAPDRWPGATIVPWRAVEMCLRRAYAFTIERNAFSCGRCVTRVQTRRWRACAPAILLGKRRPLFESTAEFGVVEDAKRTTVFGHWRLDKAPPLIRRPRTGVSRHGGRLVDNNAIVSLCSPPPPRTDNKRVRLRSITTAVLFFFQLSFSQYLYRTQRRCRRTVNARSSRFQDRYCRIVPVVWPPNGILDFLSYGNVAILGVENSFSRERAISLNNYKTTIFNESIGDRLRWKKI